VQYEPEKLNDGKEKQPYQKPELRKHGSIEQITGFQGDTACPSGFPCDEGI
jgi:hypothetical protein